MNTLVVSSNPVSLYPIVVSVADVELVTSCVVVCASEARGARTATARLTAKIMLIHPRTMAATYGKPAKILD